MKTKSIRRALKVLGLAILLGQAASTAGEDWPQWRGPERDGVWRETGIVDRLPGGRLPRRWTAPIISVNLAAESEETLE